jgi:hypothetical protein
MKPLKFRHMHYCIISFHITIDGKDMGTGLIGRISSTIDYRPNLLVGSIIKHYRKNYPGSKVVNVKLLKAKEVSQEKYNNELKSLVEINPDS